MMKIPNNLKQDILAGKIFIYPTDTIYGLGCDATNKISVEKIKIIKNRDRDKTLSVIAPDIKCVEDNFIIDCNLEEYFPGPYTIILKKKDLAFLNWVSQNDSVGIRIPNHPITKNIQKAGVPFITTSVNLSGEPFAIKIEDIKPEIKQQVDIILESQVELSGKPSKLIINGKEVERK